MINFFLYYNCAKALECLKDTNSDFENKAICGAVSSWMRSSKTLSPDNTLTPPPIF